jgi:hypothetical protein
MSRRQAITRDSTLLAALSSWAAEIWAMAVAALNVAAMAAATRIVNVIDGSRA